METEKKLGIPLICIMLVGLILPVCAADPLTASDFKKESFSRTVDFFEYVRAYAANNSMSTPPGFQNHHAYLYMNYINTSGLHLLYAGLDNITFGGPISFKIPMQSFIMHYKTNNHTRDVLLASTFLMLLAFNETSDSIHAGSPDMNDTLWASFSMGFDMNALNASLPLLNSRTQKFPLTRSDDGLRWSWGMRYTNLTALWWRTWINPTNPHYENSWPVAVTVYDELTFTYNLTINPTTHTATLTENHVIGRMRDMLLFSGLIWTHYNNTGTYWLGHYIPGSDNIYDFIQKNKIKMSIVNFQTSALLDRETYSRTAAGNSVTDMDIPVDNTSIDTYVDDGEKICTADFGTKKTYKLYNYTADPEEHNFTSYDATARTAKTGGFARNTGLFIYHIGLMKFLPLVVVHVYPQLYWRARETVTNMSRANYFYLIGYPTYGGYRVEHDPTLTVYLTTDMSPSSTGTPYFGLFVLIGSIIIIVTLAIVAVKLRKKPKETQPPLTR